MSERWKPTIGDQVLCVIRSAQAVVAIKWEETELKLDDYRLGLIFPDTPEGMKAARKKAGLDQ